MIEVELSTMDCSSEAFLADSLTSVRFWLMISNNESVSTEMRPANGRTMVKMSKLPISARNRAVAPV